MASCFATTKENTWTTDINNTEISLLTCSPGDQIYSIFGHSAVRIHNPNTNLDMVVNYGLFDFNQENFILKFIKGETDYMCGAEPYNYFVSSYAWRGSGIKETVLDFTNEEKERFLQVISHDLKKEHREYRYNFAYNNCATKIRDIINYAYSGKYQSTITPETSFRQTIGHYAKNYPWYMFGIDICLGGEEYNTITNADEIQFIPEHLDKAVIYSTINRDGQDTKPNTVEKIILEPTKEVEGPSLITPSTLCLIILLLSIANYFWGEKCVVVSKIYSGTLFFSCIIIGAVVTFLMFFSEHPFTSGNPNICIFNPLYIIPFIALFIKNKNKLIRISIYLLICMSAFFSAYLLIFKENVNFAFWYLSMAVLLELIKVAGIIKINNSK